MYRTDRRRLRSFFIDLDECFVCYCTDEQVGRNRSHAGKVSFGIVEGQRSFGNLGVTVGSLIGGLFIANLGTQQVIWSGLIFLVLGSLTIALRAKLYSSKKAKLNGSKKVISNY
jgi:hypothetical protein